MHENYHKCGLVQSRAVSKVIMKCWLARPVARGRQANEAGCLIIALNPLNVELYPICHLLALLGAHHILHVSMIRVNLRSDLFYPSFRQPV